MSKVADMSRRASVVTLPFSILSKTSLSTFKRADSVEWNYFLYADCKSLDIQLASMWESRRDATMFSNIFDIKLKCETGRYFLVHFYLEFFLAEVSCMLF